MSCTEERVPGDAGTEDNLSEAKRVCLANREKYDHITQLLISRAKEMGCGVYDGEVYGASSCVYANHSWDTAKALCKYLYDNGGEIAKYCTASTRGNNSFVSADGMDIICVRQSELMYVLDGSGLNEETRVLIDLKCLTDISRATDWGPALSRLYEWTNASDANGGGKRHKAQHTRNTKTNARARNSHSDGELTKISEKKLVVVGPKAADIHLGRQTGGRYQVISKDLKSAGRTWTGLKCGLSDVGIFCDPRLRRLTCKSSSEFVDIYSQAEYSLVPFVTKRIGGADVRVGTPLLVAYYKLVDSWIIKNLAGRSKVTTEYSADFTRRAMEDVRRLVDLALSGDPQDQLPIDNDHLYGTYIDEMRQLKLEGKSMFYMPGEKN